MPSKSIFQILVLKENILEKQENKVINSLTQTRALGQQYHVA